MGPLGLPLAACAVIAGCLGPATTEPSVDVATIRSIDGYCAASWRRAHIPRHDWDDCSQQTFVRLLTRVSQDKWVEAINNAQSRQRRELNRCIWATTQWWRRTHRHRSPVAEDFPDRAKDPVVGATAHEVLETMHCKASGLTPIQRSVIELWASGHGIQEMAAKLEVSARRVSDEKYRAIAKLRARFGNC